MKLDLLRIVEDKQTVQEGLPVDLPRQVMIQGTDPGTPKRKGFNVHCGRTRTPTILICA